MDVDPGNYNDFRVGDEEPDARIGDFKVFGGTPSDRAALQDGDPTLIAGLDEELQTLLQKHDDETDLA